MSTMRTGMIATMTSTQLDLSKTTGIPACGGFLLLVAAALAVFPPARTCAVEPAAQPNILLIYADDLDADEIGFSDDPTAWPSYTGKAKLGISGGTRQGRSGYVDSRMLTPHIDSLAAGGAVLTRFYITSPVCTPSRYSLLTGRLASRSEGFVEKYPAGSHATMGWDTSIGQNESSLAKCLQQAGYKTGVVGKWHNFPKGRLFNKEYVLPHNPTLADYQQRGAAEGIRANYEMALKVLRHGYGWDFVDRINIGNTVFNLEWMIEGALEFIDKSKDQPFFLYVSLPVPHGQYTSNYCNVAKLEPRATSAGLIDRLPNVMPSRQSVYQRLEQAGIAAENAMGTHMDDAVGALLTKLDEIGVRDNTFVFFVGDNPSRGKNSDFEGAREPAIANWPGHIKAKTRVASLCANTDVTATLVAAAAGSLPDDIAQDSYSFLPQLLGQPDPPDWREAVLLEIGNTKAAVTQRWKYIANRVPDEVAAKIKADADRATKTRKTTYSLLDGLESPQLRRRTGLCSLLRCRPTLRSGSRSVRNHEPCVRPSACGDLRTNEGPSEQAAGPAATRIW